MKKIIILSFALLSVVVMYGQGFKSFTVDGQLFPTYIKDYSNSTSLVDVVVGKDTDLKNIKFQYHLYSRSFLLNDISPDFTEPQYVTITKRGVGEKTWKVRVKPLIPAKLPLTLNFSKSNLSEWSSSVVGWTGIGIDEKKNTVVRFGNHGVSFIVAFDEDAKYISYDLTPVSKEPVQFMGEFIVETSTDAKVWKPLKKFDEDNNFDSSNNYTHSLEKGVRYIKWTYVDRVKLNINLNNINVTPAE